MELATTVGVAGCSLERGVSMSRAGGGPAVENAMSGSVGRAVTHGRIELIHQVIVLTSQRRANARVPVRYQEQQAVSQ